MSANKISKNFIKSRFQRIYGFLKFQLWYNCNATTPRQVQKGGMSCMNFFTSFLLSIVASIVAYYICKWLDGDDKR